LVASRISKGILKDIIIVGVGVFVIWIGLQIIFGTENPFYVVSSGSMIPVLQVNDVLIVQGNTSFDEVKKGDIIVFNRPSGHDRVIVHRVVSIIDEEPFTIKTKGDANPASIPGTDFPITEDEYIGQVAYVVPQIGIITEILKPPINYVIIAIIIVIMIFKQISKKKEEKEFHFDDLIDSDKDVTESSIKWDNLDSIPQDDVYIDSETKENETKYDEENRTKTFSKNSEDSEVKG